MNTFRFIFAVLSATGGSAFNQGYQAGVINTLLLNIMYWYGTVRQNRNSNFHGFYHFNIMGPFIMAVFPLGGIVGALLICVAATFIGRKVSLIICNGLIIFGLIIVGLGFLGKSYEGLIIGRFVMGISAGLSSGISPMYVVEISPACVRGRAGSLYYVIMAASMVLGSILGLPEVMGGPKLWMYMSLSGIFPALLEIITMACCPDSPRYLYLDKQDTDSAEEALLWFNNDGDIDEDLDELKEEEEILTEIGQPGCCDLFANQIFRSPLIITTVFMFGQKFCGADVMIYCSSDLFAEYGYTIKEQGDFTIGLGVCNLVAAIICMICVDRIGRKILFLASLAGMVLCICCAGFIFLLLTFDDVPRGLMHGAIVFLFLYVVFYGIGVGSIPWFYSAELCNHFARPMTMTFSVTTNWLMSFTLLMSFLALRLVIGNAVYLLYLPCTLFTLIFALLTMRETNDVMLMDVAELFYD